MRGPEADQVGQARLSQARSTLLTPKKPPQADAPKASLDAMILADDFQQLLASPGAGHKT